MAFEIKQGIRSLKNTLMNFHPMEVKVREATSNDAWGASGTLLRTIAEASFNYEDYRIIMDTLWKRMSDSGKNYRHVYKSMQLLEYLIMHGAERCIDEAKENVNAVRTLKHFQYIDESGKDQGLNIREKSKKLAVLIGNDQMIAAEREKAHKTTEKIRGYSAGGSVGDSYRSSREPGRYSMDRYRSEAAQPAKAAKPAPTVTVSDDESSFEDEDEEPAPQPKKPAQTQAAPRQAAPQPKQAGIEDLFENFSMSAQPAPAPGSAQFGAPVQQRHAPAADPFDPFAMPVQAAPVQHHAQQAPAFQASFGDDEWAEFDDDFGGAGQTKAPEAKTDDWGYGLVNLDVNQTQTKPGHSVQSSKKPTLRELAQTQGGPARAGPVMSTPVATTFTTPAYPPQAYPGYPPQQPHPQAGYPPQAYSGYPPQHGYPPQAQPGYPPQAYPGYPPQQPQKPPQSNNDFFF